MLSRITLTIAAAALVVTGSALTTSTVAGADTASATRAATVVPRTPSRLPSAIESMTDYTGQTACDPVVRPGTRKLADLLTTTYRAYGATSWASAYACGTDAPQSEHYEGRAIDWMVDIHDKRQHAAALAAIKWLLATDKAGNQFAMARRLGVMYLIYDNRMWGSWDGRWEPYNNCAHTRSAAYDNACHRTHIHISLSWNGAMGRTSFWTRKVHANDFGPCRPADLNWASSYTGFNPNPCPEYPEVVAPKGSSALKQTLVKYSGARVHRNSNGPIVSAVQSALHVSADGSYGASTVAAVKRFQSRRHLHANGVMNPPTWRLLLKAVK
jgi:hypothetical protein